MDVDTRADVKVAAIAAAIGEPARTRMLYCLMDGRARTSTELAVVADVSQSTASEHLRKLSNANLVRVVAQGKHRYYSLQGVGIAGVLEKLSVLGEGASDTFVPKTPERLRSARTCYDHLAGTIGVTLHDHFCAQGWLAAVPRATDNAYRLTSRGTAAFEALGIDVESAQAQRRRFAFGCLDWSERRFHVGGAIGAAFYAMALKKRWVTQDLDSRAVALTTAGRREMSARFGVQA